MINAGPVTESVIDQSLERLKDPCNPGLVGPSAPPLDIVGQVQNAAFGVLDAAKDAQAQYEYQVNLLASNLRSLADFSSITKGLGSITLPSIQGIQAGTVLNQLKDLVTRQGEALVKQVVQAELNKLTNLSLLELSKGTEPILNALQSINRVAGQAGAVKALVNAALNGQDCAAKAELLSEIYFRMKR